MRISTYALTTNPKYANFFEWQALAGKALSTPVGAAKLGAGIGAGVGAINYLGSEDKSIGNLAGQVAGGAALGGATGYAGSSLRNAWQARKAGNQAMLPPAAQPVQRPQPTQNGVIVPPAPQVAGSLVPPTPQGTQSGQSRPTSLANPNPVGATTERTSPKSQKKRPEELNPNEPQGSTRRRGKPTKSANPADYGQMDASRNTSPFANFKVRRYNGFVY